MADILNQPVKPEGGPATPESVSAGHEVSDINVRAVLYFAAGLTALALVIHVSLAGMYFLFKDREDRQKASAYPLATQDHTEIPPPRLEGIEKRTESTPVPGVSQPDDTKRYSWTDEEKEIVGVPVEEAIRQMLRNPPQGVRGRKWEDAGPRPPSDANSGRSKENKP